jgi:hypothetical protein
MPTLTKLIALLFGVIMVGLGLFAFFSPDVTLPTRQPPIQFHFSGLSRFLLGLSPLSAGLISIAIALGKVHGESRTSHVAIGISIISMMLAIVLAPTA